MTLTEILDNKYQTIFSIPFDPKANRLCVTYGDTMCESDCSNVASGLSRMAIPTDETGIPVCIDRSVNGGYVVDSPLNGKVYNIIGREYRETLLWVLYCMSFGISMECFYSADCYDIETKGFSSDRNAAASILKKEADYQVNGFSEKERLKKVCDRISANICEEFLDSAPLCSASPVAENVFEELRGGIFPRTIRGVSLKELTKQLFSGKSYVKEIESYCSFISEKKSYLELVEQSRKQLDDFMYSIPLAAIPEAWNVLHRYIDTLSDDETIHEPNKSRMISHFVLTRNDMKAVFSEVDEFGKQIAKRELLLNTFNNIIENSDRNELLQEAAEADAKINQLRIELSDYLISDFAEEDDKHMSWKALANLEEKNIRIVNTEWTLDSFSGLSMKVSTDRACQKWFMPESLKKLCDDNLLQDANLRVPLPLNNSKCVWAMWITPHREEAENIG